MHRTCYKAFGRNKVLNGLNLGIPEGMITVVLGPSGPGKSVLIKHLIGLMFPDSGDVDGPRRVGPEHDACPSCSRCASEFGILFQDGALFGSMNVYDNVAFPLRQHTDMSEAEIAEIVNQRLDRRRPRGAPSKDAEPSSPAGCASAPASPARSCSSRRS